MFFVFYSLGSTKGMIKSYFICMQLIELKFMFDYLMNALFNCLDLYFSNTVTLFD